MCSGSTPPSTKATGGCPSLPSLYNDGPAVTTTGPSLSNKRLTLPRESQPQAAPAEPRCRQSLGASGGPTVTSVIQEEKARSGGRGQARKDAGQMGSVGTRQPLTGTAARHGWACVWRPPGGRVRGRPEAGPGQSGAVQVGGSISTK